MGQRTIISIVIIPLPVEKIHVELDGSKGQASLEVDGLGLLGLVTKQSQLSVSSLRGRQLLDVRNKLDLVHLYVPQ